MKPSDSSVCSLFVTVLWMASLMAVLDPGFSLLTLLTVKVTETPRMHALNFVFIVRYKCSEDPRSSWMLLVFRFGWASKVVPKEFSRERSVNRSIIPYLAVCVTMWLLVVGDTFASTYKWYCFLFLYLGYDLGVDDLYPRFLNCSTQAVETVHAPPAEPLLCFLLSCLCILLFDMQSSVGLWKKT